MSVRSRQWPALAAAPLLVLSLAACASEPVPEAEPLPTATPAPTETVAPPTPPGSRVPATCEQLFADLDGFAGAPAAPVDVDYVPLQAVLDQAGFLFCEAEGTVGDTAVMIRGVVGIDIDQPSARPSNAVDAGDLGWTQCQDPRDFSFCLSEVFVGEYAFEFSTSPSGPVTSDFRSAIVSVVTDLGDRMAAWPPPVAAWVAPDGVLAWANDCETEVAATDSVIRAALPFTSNPPSFGGSGDGFPLIYEAEKRQNYTYCSWSGTEGTGWLTIAIAPGAAWMIEQGASLPGEPIDYPGALAASVVDDPEYSNVSVWVVIDGSIVIVDLIEGGPEGDRAAAAAAAVRVVDAIVAEFGAS